MLFGDGGAEEEEQRGHVESTKRWTSPEFVVLSKVEAVSLFLVAMISLCCVLALGLLSPALGRERAEGDGASRLRTLQRERLVSDRTEVSARRRALKEPTCTALRGLESALLNDTSSVSVREQDFIL